MKVRGWMPLALLLITAASAMADTFVVAVGVEQYDDLRVSSLRYAIADAKAVAGTFRASGVPFDHVTVLTSEQRKPDRRPSRVRVLTALEDVAERAKAGDTLVFFFAGHGIEQDGEQYLMTVDTRRSLVSDTALPMRLVTKALSGIGASNVLFILDACRNDPDSGRGDRDAPLTDGLARGLRPMLAEQGGPTPHVATLLSCDVGQRAWEDPGQGHGAFTVYLLKALRGAAGSPVTLKKMADYVTRETSAWAKRAKREQSPKLLDPDNQDMQLLTPPAEPMVSVSFQNDTLAKVVDVLAEQYGVPIVVGRGVDVESKVTGHLDNQPLSVTLKVLLKAHDLSVQRDGDVYVILPPGQTVEPPAPKEEAYQVTGDELVVDQQKGPYKTITEAVKAAKAGGTVLVKPGTYREQVVINKPLTIVGDGDPNEVRIVSQVTQWEKPVLCVAAGPSRLRSLCVVAEEAPGVLGGTAHKVNKCAVVVQAEALLSEVVLSAPTDDGFGCVVWPPAVAQLDGCQVKQAECGLAVYQTGGVIMARHCRLVTSYTGVSAGGGEADLRECRIVSAVTGVVASGTATVRLNGCDLAETPDGAFLRGTDVTIVHRDCTFAPSDSTVTESPAAPVVPMSFANDTIMVDPSGSGDYRSLLEAARAAKPGSRLRLTPGRYNGMLYLTKPLTIEGTGQPGDVIIEATGMEALQVRGAKVTVRAATLWSPVGPRRIRGSSGTVCAGFGAQLSLEDCVVENVDPSARAAASAMSSGNLSLVRCRVRGGTQNGINVSSGGRVTLSDCAVADCGGAGLWLDPKFGRPALSMTGCTVQRCQKGGILAVRQTGQPPATISAAGGTIRDNQGNGVLLQGPVTATFEKTAIVGSASAGLALRNGAKATVTGCDLRGNGQGPFDIGPGCTLDQKDNQLGR